MMLAALMCLGLALLVRTPWLQGIDGQVTHEVQEHPNAAFDLLFETLTFLGNTATLVTVAAIAAALLVVRKLPRAAVFSVLSLLALPLDVAIKDVVERARPNSDIVRVLTPVSGYSFPSGHSMGSAAVYGMLAYLTFVHLRRAKRAVSVSFGVLPFAIALSRIYVGAHWMSDVLAGLSAGAFVVLALVHLYSLPGRAEDTHEDQPLDGTLTGNVPPPSAHRQAGA